MTKLRKTFGSVGFHSEQKDDTVVGSCGTRNFQLFMAI